MAGTSAWLKYGQDGISNVGSNVFANFKIFVHLLILVFSLHNKNPLTKRYSQESGNYLIG